MHCALSWCSPWRHETGKSSTKKKDSIGIALPLCGGYFSFGFLPPRTQGGVTYKCTSALENSSLPLSLSLPLSPLSLPQSLFSFARLLASAYLFLCFSFETGSLGRRRRRRRRRRALVLVLRESACSYSCACAGRVWLQRPRRVLRRTRKQRKKVVRGKRGQRERR